MHPVFNQIESEMKRLFFTLLTVVLCLTGNAQESSADSTLQKKKASRLSVGGYGEANFTRNYFSDHVTPEMLESLYFHNTDKTEQ